MREPFEERRDEDVAWTRPLCRHAVGRTRRTGDHARRIAIHFNRLRRILHRERARDPLFPGDADINASAAYVSFAPGARSAWHTHPAGQRLVVVSGVGLTQ